MPLPLPLLGKYSDYGILLADLRMFNSVLQVSTINQSLTKEETKFIQYTGPRSLFKHTAFAKLIGWLIHSFIQEFFFECLPYQQR